MVVLAALLFLVRLTGHLAQSSVLDQLVSKFGIECIYSYLLNAIVYMLLKVIAGVWILMVTQLAVCGVMAVPHHWYVQVGTLTLSLSQPLIPMVTTFYP